MPAVGDDPLLECVSVSAPIQPRTWSIACLNVAYVDKFSIEKTQFLSGVSFVPIAATCVSSVGELTIMPIAAT